MAKARTLDRQLNPYIPKVRFTLEEAGYRPETIRQKLRLIPKLDWWLTRQKVHLSDLNDEIGHRFLKYLRATKPRSFSGARNTLRRLLQLLRVLRIIASEDGDCKSGGYTPSKRITRGFQLYLKDERGLDRATIYNYSRHIDRFLSCHYGTGAVRLRKLRAVDILSFVRRESRRLARGHTAQLICGLRSFLRYIRYRGYINHDLAMVVPGVANWEVAGLPKQLPGGAVQRVLAHCERETVTGRRNYAILLMLARLGLRAAEIVALKLDDIDWENGEIIVRSKKGPGLVRVPLTKEVGTAIVQYLEGRSRSLHRNLFIRDYAPYSPFVASGPISVLVRKAIEKAGIDSKRTGAHVFRHTLACDMLRNGASIDEIGRVLRHKHPDSTMIYAKVDVETLRQLALPWPGTVP